MSHQTSTVSLHYLVKYGAVKNLQYATITLENEQNTGLRSQWMICTMYTLLESPFWISCVLKNTFVSGQFWLNKLSSSFTVVPFSLVMGAFRSAALCLWSVLRVSQLFLVKCPVIPFCSLFSKIPPVSFANRILWTDIIF